MKTDIIIYLILVILLPVQFLVEDSELSLVILIVSISLLMILFKPKTEKQMTEQEKLIAILVMNIEDLIEDLIEDRKLQYLSDSITNLVNHIKEDK